MLICILRNLKQDYTNEKSDEKFNKFDRCMPERIPLLYPPFKEEKPLLKYKLRRLVNQVCPHNWHIKSPNDSKADVNPQIL